MTPREKAEKAQQYLDDDLAKAVHAELREMLIFELEREADTDRQLEIVKRLQLHRLTRRMYEKYAEQLLVDTHKANEDTLMEKLRQRLHPWSGA